MSAPTRIALFVLALVAGVAQTADPLMISSGNDRAIPIAVVSFGFQGGNVLPEDVLNIAGNDPCSPGYFEPPFRQDITNQPAQASEVVFRDWKAVGASCVIVGSIVPADGRLQIQYVLSDAGTEQQALTGNVIGSTDQLRDMSHYIADQLFEKPTGIKSAFPTKMFYIVAERFPVDNTRYTLRHPDYDGAHPVILLQSREPIVSLYLSPDGRRIAYVSFEQKRPRIFIRYVSTSRRERITNFEGPNDVPALSPNGNRLAFVPSRDGSPEIYVIDSGSRALHRLTNNLAIGTEPFWGKGGSAPCSILDRGGESQIYKMNVNNGAVDRVTSIGNYGANPKLSASEKILVMVYRQQDYTSFQIIVQDLRRGNLRMLSNTTLDDPPTVAPNGTTLTCATRQQNRGVLMPVSINGRIRVPLPIIQDDAREPSQPPYLNQ